LSRGRGQEKKQDSRIKQTAEFEKKHGTMANCNKTRKYEALLRVHGWRGSKGIGGGTSRTWPKSIPALMQALQEFDALVKKEDLQSLKSTSTKPLV